MQISNRPPENISEIKASALPTQQGVEMGYRAIQRFVRENVTGAFTEVEMARNELYAGRFCDTFLRHLSPYDRVQRAEYITRRTVSFLNWEKRLGRGQVGRGLFGQTMQIERDEKAYDVFAHESMHVMQNAGEIQPNYPITYAINELFSAQRGDIELYPKGDEGFSVFKSAYRSKTSDDYFNEVLSGGSDLPNWFFGGWRLNLKDERYQDLNTGDKSLRDFKRYLEIENQVGLEILLRGECSYDIMGINDVYTTITNIGTARGLRAFGVGHFTKNPQNAWTVLWLHSLGMKFEDAERLVVQKFIDGTISDFDIHNPIEGKDFSRIKANEEVMKTRKLNQPPIQEAVGKNTRRIQQYFRLFGRAYKQLPQVEIDSRYSIFNDWLSHNRVIDTETGETFLVLDDISAKVDYELQESIKHVAERSGKIFAHFDRTGHLRQLSIPQVAQGTKHSTIPPEYKLALPEEIGYFHTHIYHEAPPSIVDLINFVDNQTKFVSIMATSKKDYVFVKCDKSKIDENNRCSTGSRIKYRINLAKQYLQRLSNNEDPEIIIIEMAKAQGLEVYVRNKIVGRYQIKIEQFKKV